MKKIALLFTTLSLMMTSCSGDSSSNFSVPILVTKIIKESNSNIETREFTYNGTKLINEFHSNGTTKHYTYSGDLISYIETKDNDNVTINEFFIEYNNENKIVKTIDLNHIASNPNIAGFRREYIYNSNGTILKTEFYGTISNQDNFSYKSLLYFDSQNQRIKFEDMNVNDEVILSWQFNYDGNNSPFKNVMGYHFFIFGDFYDSDDMIYGLENNISTVEDLFITGTNAYSAVCQYTYNSSNYPLTNNYSNSNGDVENYEYFYNE